MTAPYPTDRPRSAAPQNPAALCLDFISERPADLARDLQGRLLRLADEAHDPRTTLAPEKMLRQFYCDDRLSAMTQKGRMLTLRAHVDYVFTFTFDERRQVDREKRLAESAAKFGEKFVEDAILEARHLGRLYVQSRPAWEIFRDTQMSLKAISAYEHAIWPSDLPQT